MKQKKKYFDIFFEKVISIWSENIADDKIIDERTNNLLGKIKTTRTEHEQIKKLLKLAYLKKKKIETSIFASESDPKIILSILKKIL